MVGTQERINRAWATGDVDALEALLGAVLRVATQNSEFVTECR
jgi:hypothetical protein